MCIRFNINISASIYFSLYIIISIYKYIFPSLTFSLQSHFRRYLQRFANCANFHLTINGTSDSCSITFSRKRVPFNSKINHPENYDRKTVAKFPILLVSEQNLWKGLRADRKQNSFIGTEGEVRYNWGPIKMRG